MLDGIFSFVLLDTRDNSFIVARDAIGVTSLYIGWGLDGNNVIICVLPCNWIEFMVLFSLYLNKFFFFNWANSDVFGALLWIQALFGFHQKWKGWMMIVNILSVFHLVTCTLAKIEGSADGTILLGTLRLFHQLLMTLLFWDVPLRRYDYDS